MIRINKMWLVIVAAVAMATGCKKWDDHNAITDASLTKDLFQQISEDATLSMFKDLLVKTGYDKVLASSKTFTVFAPDNTALASLDAGIISDTAKLRKFVGNHIANQTYYTSAAVAKMRILMLNGKYNDLLSKDIEGATIITADKGTKNGVLQIVDKMLPVLDNAWETMQNNASIPAAQKAYILAQFRKVFDNTTAVQVGVDPLTGNPIYQQGTDSVTTNLFWRNVYDLRDERKEFSFFILTDDAWDMEVNKLKQYYATGTADSTTNLSSWNVVKDLAVDTVYTAASLPDTIMSKFDVKVPLTKSNIVQTIKTSNGNIYILSKADVQPKDKIHEMFIQGENYRGTSDDRRGNTYFRDRYNPSTGKDFKDVLVFNHGKALFTINYQLKAVPSMTYRAYWVALNDFQTATFSQKLAIGGNAVTTIAYKPVVANVYDEVLIGEFTLNEYQSVLDINLVAANSGTAAVNPLVCDYIRLEPLF
ncbi:MAG: fasciclin domain-containing protein [Ferruginibacter sp.]